MKQHPAGIDFISSVNALEKEIDKTLNERLSKALDLSIPEVRLLLCIRSTEAVSVTTLGRLTGYDRGQASRVVSDLEARGLVEKARSATDARGLQIRLTSLGCEVHERALEMLRSGNEEILSILADDEWSALVSALDKIIERLGNSPET